MNKSLKLLVVFCLAVSAELLSVRVISKYDDHSYFIMEKINEKNIGDWYSFSEEAKLTVLNWISTLSYIAGIIPLEQLTERHRKLLEPIEQVDNDYIKELRSTNRAPLEALKKKYPILKAMPDGISNFNNGLGNSLKPLSDVWVAYISLLNPNKKAPNSEKFANIEMAFTVLVKPGSPVSMHMGIFRNPSYFMSNKVQHAKISSMLHAFAARVVREEYPTLKYMITTPQQSMASLFKEVLPKESYAEGMNKPGTWITRALDNNGEPTLAYYSGYKFEIYDRDITHKQKKLELLIDDQNKEDYWWLINRLHESLTLHPYFVVRLGDLANLFTGNLERI